LPQGKKQLQQFLQEVGKKKKAEGYPTGETLLYKPIKASEFIKSSDHVELLANTSEILLDQEWIENSKYTNDDIKDYCKDVKVLGKKEIKALVSWRKNLREKWDQFMKLKSGDTDNVGELGQIDTTIIPEEEGDGSDTETKLEEALEEIRETQKKMRNEKERDYSKK